MGPYTVFCLAGQQKKPTKQQQLKKEKRKENTVPVVTI
jgi:hypothetical protein